VAVLLVMLLSMAALAIDYGHMAWVQYELKKAAEASALAGARALWPMNLWDTSGTRPDPNCDAPLSRALNTATSNEADGANLATSEVAVEVGRWDYATQLFTPGNSSSANGVRVTTQRNNVQMYFARIFGIFSKDLSARAIAVMDFAGAVGQGTLPIAINKDYTIPGTILFINFTPDTIDNGGWFAERHDIANAATFKDYIDNAACPPLRINDIINLQNGQDSSVLKDLNDKLLSQPSKTLDTLLPVVDADKFNQDQPIIAFVPFRITQVQTTGNPKGVTGTVISLGTMQSAQPGGSNYGALAPPKLVQ
jgi:hypothetical protein